MMIADDGFSNYTAMLTRRTELAAALRPANKTALFTPLAEAGVATINVEFDGAGDSGQIQAIEYLNADGWPVGADSQTTIALAAPSHDGLEIERQALSLADAVERFVYDCLEETHAGWEIDAGAYGTFNFDVTAGTIRLDYHERYEASEHFEHEL